QIEPVERIIRDRLGELIFGVEVEDLQDVLVRRLTRDRLTIATAEGVTSGLVGRLLGQVPGASACFRGGMIAYDNTSKSEMLSVPESLIDAHGVVSAPVAEAMAISCRTRFGTDLAVSTVGLAGPEGSGKEKPVGLVFVAVSWEGGVRSQ